MGIPLRCFFLASGERLEICDCFIGRRGFLSYLKALGGSNVVKVVPSNGSASGAQAAENGIILDTEVIRYKYPSLDMVYPEWQNLIPGDLGNQAYFDSKEAIKASQSLGAMWISQYLKPQFSTLVLSIGDNRLTLTAQGNTGSQAHIPADTDGEAIIALQARYLTQALKACGGMVTLKVKDENSPMLFEADGYRFLVMPMTDVLEVAS